MDIQGFPDENGDQIPDDTGFTVNQNVDGMPDWVDVNMPDWNNIDWNSFSTETLDWNNIPWTSEAWQEFLQGITGGDADTTIDVCPILQTAIGMGYNFGIAGKCHCEGTLGNGLRIDCNFNQCVESLVCGDIGLNFTFDDTTGFVKTNTCVNTTTDDYEQVCFSYQTEMPESGDIVDLERTCEATYGGNPCTCAIDGLCLAIDCSAYLPGAKMDTCQYLAFEEAEDSASFMPRFSIFNNSFGEHFAFEDINWTNIDWENLDWNHFGFDKVNWTSVESDSTSWGSLFGNSSVTDQICPILSSRVLGMNEEVFGGGCSCSGDVTSGISISCSFKEECVATTPGEGVAIARMNASFPQTTICGDVNLDLGFNNVGSISGNLCVDYADDIHPITCIDYSIPIADVNNEPTCEATYGGKSCKCSIDQSLCVSVDCSEYESTAVTDTCQVLTLAKQDDVENLVLKFAVPATVASNGNEDETTSQSSEGGDSDKVSNDPFATQGNEANIDNSSATSQMSFVVLTIAAILSFVIC